MNNLGQKATRSPLARLRPLATLRERRSLDCGTRVHRVQPVTCSRSIFSRQNSFTDP
ncbi:MAG: hypothetical protein F6J98_16195 [Moorea sp. SIO4G2]|nr:hypothetical protein [Moorena sp. SIO4G2]